MLSTGYTVHYFSTALIFDLKLPTSKTNAIRQAITCRKRWLWNSWNSDGNTYWKSSWLRADILFKYMQANVIESVDSGLGTLAMLAFHHKVAKSTECCNIKVLQNPLLLTTFNNFQIDKYQLFWQSFVTTLASVLSKKSLT